MKSDEPKPSNPTPNWLTDGGEMGERVRALIHESEERFRALVEASSDVVYRMSPDWSEMRLLLGRHFIADTNEPIAGWLQKYIHPDDQPRVMAAIQSAIRRKSVFELEHRVLRVDGTLGWTFSRAVPIKNANGEIVEWLGMASDITERKQAEHVLREDSKRKDEFLAMLGHELRNPLAAIRNAAQILLRTDSDVQAHRAAAEIVNRQVAHMVRQVDDLLDVSRISRGKIELRRERIELAPVVNDAVEASRTLVESFGHELNVTLPPSPLHVDGDPIRLAQVVSNLLNNACKFTGKSGRIWLTMAQEGGFAVIRIRDSGIGILADELGRIFEIFSQLDQSHERTRDGLGLGLTLVKNLVEMHGGTVEARSLGLGQGSEFVVRLPLLAPAKSNASPSDSGRTKNKNVNPRRVLVVDDHRDSANSLALFLRMRGHEVDIAYDGLEAVEKAATFQADVILLDLGMPGLNGYDAAVRIREQGQKGLTLVAVSGWGQDEDIRRCRESGFNTHLLKPVDMAGLSKLVAEAGGVKYS